jgi:hypothetical protein
LSLYVPAAALRWVVLCATDLPVRFPSHT